MHNRFLITSKIIETALQKNFPFVVYRLPGENTIYTWLQKSGHFSLVENIGEIIEKPGFVYAPFHRRTNFPVVFFEPEIIMRNEEGADTILSELLSRDQIYPDYTAQLPYQTEQERYFRQIKELTDSFDDDFIKAVLSRIVLREKPDQFKPADHFFTLVETYPNAFIHLINIPGTGSWTGASPETLLRIEGEQASTISLAGTQSADHVNWCTKEIEEQEIVTDYIIQILHDFSIDDFKLQKTRNLIAGNIVHLASIFDFRSTSLKGRLAEFIQRLHPTPAVCGQPKHKALERILDVEKHNREYYAGFCGPVDFENKTDLFVNLRCMKILPKFLAVYAGGGITKKSNQYDEWNETRMKGDTILALI